MKFINKLVLKSYLAIWLLLTITQLGCSGNNLKILHKPAFVNTVNGQVYSSKLGVILPHEHVLVDFIGADQINVNRYNPDEAFFKILPYLQKLKQQGCQTLIECTPAYLGRNVVLLQRLSKASGLTIITNTGYYGAMQGKFLPAHAFNETAEQLAARWILEAEQGIDNTKIKPGFLKISVDGGLLSAVNQKVVKAAALTHLKTGLTVASHTGNGEAALAQLKILQQNGVAGEAFIWVHAQNEKDTRIYQQAVKSGAWLEFDGISTENIAEYVLLLQEVKAAGLLPHTLISQDAGWYHVGEKQGGEFRGYDSLFTVFLPALKNAGFTQTEIKQLIEINSQKAFGASIKSR